MKKIVSMFLVLGFLVSFLSFYSFGEVNAATNQTLKGKWKYKTTTVNVDGKKQKKRIKYSYKYVDGSTPSGVTQVGKYYYLFDARGVLKKSKEPHRFVKSKGRYFWINSGGKAESGWVNYNGNLYYFSPKYYKAVANKVVDGITLGLDKKAVKTLDLVLKMQCQEVLNAICSPADSMDVKLSRAFDYMSSGYFAYAGKYPDLGNDNWGKALASDMLATHSGNCFGFACAFAALANEIGYDAYVVTGRIHGGRDGAPDGFTRHGFVMIDGLYYDPELAWVGSSHLYGVPGCPFVIKSRLDYGFSGFVGSRMPDDSTVNVSKGDIFTANGFYHYYDEKGKEKFGVYYIDGTFYNFREGIGMSKKMGKRYKKMIKRGKPFKELRKKIGMPKKRKSAPSCHPKGKKDFVNTYEHVIIYTTLMKNGKEVIMSIKSR